MRAKGTSAYHRPFLWLYLAEAGEESGAGGHSALAHDDEVDASENSTTDRKAIMKHQNARTSCTSEKYSSRVEAKPEQSGPKASQEMTRDP